MCGMQAECVYVHIYIDFVLFLFPYFHYIHEGFHITPIFTTNTMYIHNLTLQGYCMYIYVMYI